MMPKRWNAAAGVGNQEPKRGSPDFPALDARIDALEETVARYEAIFASLAEALILITPSGEIQSMNKAALSLHQFSSLEEARLHLESGMEQHGAAGPGGHPLTPADWPLAPAISGRSLAYVEANVRNPNTGEMRMWRYTAVPVRDQSGSVILVAVTIRDVTAVKSVERALQESEERSRLAMQAGRMYTFDWNAATDDLLRSYNCASVLGIGGDAAHDTGRNFAEQIHLDDRQRVLQVRNELTPRKDSYEIQYRLIRPDGQALTLRESARAFFDAEGRMTRLVGMTADITERSRAEAALLESEHRFLDMADAAPMMIWTSGPDHKRTFFNRRWLIFTGHALEEEIEKGWATGVHPEDQERWNAVCLPAFEARRAFQIEYRLRRADGEYRYILDHGVPRFAADGVFKGYVGSCTDLTDLRRAQEEALARQKLEGLGELVGGIAHDFNNLLGSILADAELALTESAAGLSPEEEIHRIKTVAVRASEIVRELMVYAGQESISFEPTDISNLVEEMVQLLRVSISKHVTLKMVLGTRLPRVRASASQIRQVVMNLIINASEAIGDRSGILTIATERITPEQDPAERGAPNLPRGDYLLLRVSDNGRGMSEELRAKIFDPFFTTKPAGRGLGLAVVHAIVRGHGGAMSVESRLGEGTTFRICLPGCAGEKEHNVAVATPPAAEATSGAGITVLLVEDEDALRLAVSKVLRKKGFSVIEAGDGSAAVQLFRQHADHIDVVLLDMTIPGPSSSDVFAQIRGIRSDAKVVVTTAYSQEVAACSFDWHKAAGFIRKPYDLNALVRSLQAALAP
jgi:PAS domain S-box-containing protein